MLVALFSPLRIDLLHSMFISSFQFVFAYANDHKVDFSLCAVANHWASRSIAMHTHTYTREMNKRISETR